MSRAKIIDPSESYTFSKYAELAYDSADILAEFGVTLNNTSLQIALFLYQRVSRRRHRF
ncbi:hypothetical protein NIES25_37590 [Nostoc linckia NIES-25]|nr:hypothetical protein NIES25_37590 [Nostoc linckia NIES-25]